MSFAWYLARDSSSAPSARCRSTPLAFSEIRSTTYATRIGKGTMRAMSVQDARWSGS